MDSAIRTLNVQAVRRLPLTPGAAWVLAGVDPLSFLGPEDEALDMDLLQYVDECKCQMLNILHVRGVDMGQRDFRGLRPLDIVNVTEMETFFYDDLKEITP